MVQAITQLAVKILFDDSTGFDDIFFIISQSGDSNEHHKFIFYGELTNHVFWLS